MYSTPIVLNRKMIEVIFDSVSLLLESLRGDSNRVARGSDSKHYNHSNHSNPNHSNDVSISISIVVMTMVLGMAMIPIRKMSVMQRSDI